MLTKYCHRLMNAERERDANRVMLETERQRTRDLETITEKNRVDAITKEIRSNRDRENVHTELPHISQELKQVCPSENSDPYGESNM